VTSRQILAALAADLDSISRSGRMRSLRINSGIDFSSNDYLGLAASGLLADAATDALERGVAVGSGGSRLLRGNHGEHEMLECEAAKYIGSESALFFSTGFAANSALISTLPQRGDLLVHDELIHASVHEGLRLTRAHVRTARHNEVSDVERQITDWRNLGGTGTAWIAVESLYSMDGDLAPLDDFADLADKYDAMLIVDEAHATGVKGQHGRGLASYLQGRENLITLHTLGKALGCEGALVCGPKLVKEFLINRARSFIFSTAPSPLIAAIARAALRMSHDRDDLRTSLMTRIVMAENVLGEVGAIISGSQIMPLIIGEEGPTMALASSLQDAGFDVRGIRPPTVPKGSSRLRISITNNASIEDIMALADAIGSARK
jgi:8-amino-7-oxononanoate synthase